MGRSTPDTVWQLCFFMLFVLFLFVRVRNFIPFFAFEV